ncbi:MAG TPA: fumarylacetoacetase [Mycobacteriales bacterium]|nr:fumarylacetoacetase [Mycobacteriales bacterium]
MSSTWFDLDPESPFSLTNLPYGVVLCDRLPGRRVVVRVGQQVLDLGRLAERGLVPGEEWWATGSLNAFMATGPVRWREVRSRLTDLLVDTGRMDDVATAMLPLEETTPMLPFDVGDYVDFYASEHHASNVGRLLRPGQEPLPPNWRHLPIGYHGRSGTVVVSGTDIRRPCGQRLPAGAKPVDGAPEFGPTQRLDFEAEVGWVVGAPSVQGEPIPVDAFADHVFGVCLVNDWSARDIQSWEYQPLGPFLGKSFATSVSPWVVPLDALQAARCEVRSTTDGGLLPYLRESEPWGIDLSLEVRLNGTVVSRPPYRLMHWSPAQMLAHLTVNGASVRSGDLYASGTVSGPTRDEFGSLIELSDNGATPLTLDDGSTRAFLEDGDEVEITATASGADGCRIGLGEVTGTVVPALATGERPG